MPVTSFAMIVLTVIAAAALTVWAVFAWGLATVVPVLTLAGLVARWALTPVPYDENRT